MIDYERITQRIYDAKFVEGYVPNSILEQNILLSLRAAYAMGANQGEENKQVAVDAKEKEWSEYLTNSNREYAETCHKWEQIAHDACVWGDRIKAALQQIIGTAPEPQTPYERAIVTLAKNALEDNRPDGQ